MTITLRRHQVEAADAIENAWRAGIKRPLVDMCVAAGKSLTFAEVARRQIERGERVIIAAHTRELVEQNAAACRDLMPGVHVGINAEALGERTWRAPVISASIQSIHNHAGSFGEIGTFLGDEAHLWPHSESGMYRALIRGLGGVERVRVGGGTGTSFRLNGGSLVEGEDAPFDRIVYKYEIIDGIRDGYLCPAFSFGADDQIDVTKLRTSKGEFTAESSDVQMLAAMDNHIAQMVYHGRDRRAWLIFEAGTKAAKAMCARMNEWHISTGLVLGTTLAAERRATIESFRTGRLRALVNVAALTTGFDVPHVDLLVMRRPTKSLGLYIQMAGRGLRCIGGNIDASIAAGKEDCGVLDYAGNIARHGPLDFIRPKLTKARMVSCDACGARNAGAAANCWSCDEYMLKNCPACLVGIRKIERDCPHCGHDMRAGDRSDAKPAQLQMTPSGAALIASYKTGAAREGGWLPTMRVWTDESGVGCTTPEGDRYALPPPFADHARQARWIRLDAAGNVDAVLLPNGMSRTTARQIGASGAELIVPLPRVISEAA